MREPVHAAWKRIRFGVAPLAGVLLLPLFVQAAAAVSWIVNPTGTGDDFPTVQAAISSSLVLNGDTILLRDGTYTGAGNRDIDFQGKDIVVRSMNMNPQNCVIDCQGTPSTPHRGFLIHQGETSSAWLQAIKIVNGYMLYARGGGIWIDSGASPTIDACIIQNCFAEGSDGGGISCDGGSAPVIQNCRILGNGCGGIPAGLGGGIYSSPTAAPGINSCTVSGNRASSVQTWTAGGGGIYIGGGTVDFCLITSNHADGPGGGINATTTQIGYSDIGSNTTTYGVGGGAFLSGGGMIFSTIQGNFGVGGGGLMASGALVGRCTISGNTSPGDGGGGVYSQGSTIQESTISGNYGYSGGGILAVSTQLTNTIIWGNCATYQGNEIDGDATVNLTCCCTNPAGVNGAVSYSGAQVTVDPIFCAPVSCYLAPTTQGTLTLGNTSLCLPANSPCGTLIGALGQGCATAGVEGAGSPGLALRLPTIFDGPAEIVWSTPVRGPARLSIFDVEGRLVARLVEETAATTGDHHASWQGRSDAGAALPAGVYFARLETAAGALSRRIVLLGH